MQTTFTQLNIKIKRDDSGHRLEHQEKFSLSLPEESDPSTTGDSFIPIAILFGVVIFIFYIYISYGF